MGKNRKTLLIIIVIFAVILISGGVFAYTYFFTDIFRSNKQLFFKYIFENSEIIENLKPDENLKLYGKKKLNTPYTIDGKIQYKKSGAFTAQSTGMFNNLDLAISGNSDLKNNYSYRNIRVSSSNINLLEILFLNTGDYYGIKFKDAFKRFITVENNNLKAFAKKIGLDDKTIENIPNKISLDIFKDYSSIFNDNQIKQLKDKYEMLLLDCLKDDMFSINEVNSEKVYTLTINEENAKLISKTLLTEIKDDTVLFSVLKNIMVDRFKISESEANNHITDIKKSVQDMLEGSNEKNSIKKTEPLYIKVFINNSKLTKTEFGFEGEGKISIQKVNDGFIGMLNDNDEISTIELHKTSNAAEVNYTLAVSDKDGNSTEVTVNFSGLSDLNNVNEKITLKSNLAEDKYEVTFSNNAKFTESIVKNEISKDDMVLLNDAPNIAAIQKLFEKIGENITGVMMRNVIGQGIFNITENF